MQIKNIADFMTSVQKYYGGFPNEFVEELYAEELSYVKPSDYTALFQYIIAHNPASWKPDIKAVKDAINILKLDTLLDPYNERKCPVCGMINTSSGVCPTCKYAGKDDGTPEEYRAWWESWKAGKEPRIDMGAIMRNLQQKTRIQEPHDERGK